MSRGTAVLFAPLRRAAALALLLASAAAGPAGAARLPDWAAPLALRAAERAGATDRDVVLLDDTIVEVTADGRVKTVARQAKRIGTGNAKIEFASFPFEAEDKVRLRAWHFAPGQPIEQATSRDKVDIAGGDSFASGARERWVMLEGIKSGSVVFFEFEQVETPPVLELHTVLFTRDPVVHWRYALLLPEGWSARWSWTGRGPAAPVVAGRTMTWEKRDLPAWTEAPPLLDRAEVGPSTLHVALAAPSREGLPPSFADWAALSRWYDALSGEAAAPDPALRAEADRACAGAPSRLACVAALARVVRDRVRYVAIDLGREGYRPAPATATLARLYGDCKDKATLLRALLAARGIRSWGVLTASGRRDTATDGLPLVWAFNHAIVAVPLEAGDAVPPEWAGAVVDAGPPGRLLLIDATAETVAPGWIPADLAGRRMFVAAGADGRLVTAPAGVGLAHRREARWDGTRAADGSVSFTGEIVLTGEEAAAWREAWRSSGEAAREAVRRVVVAGWPGARVEDVAVVPERADGALAMTLRAAVPAPTAGSALRAFPLAETLPTAPLTGRTQAVSYERSRSARHEIVLRGAVDGLRLPEAREFAIDGATVRVAVEAGEGVARATLESTLDRTVFEPAAFGDLRKLWGHQQAATRAAFAPGAAAE